MITQITDIRTPRSAPSGAVRSIETDRLSLTALKAGDLDALMRIFGNPCVARMTHAVPWPLTRESAQSLLNDMLTAHLSHWIIRLPDDRPVGVISLTGQVKAANDDLNSFGPNLSIFIDPAYQGRGYAQEAIEGLLSHARREGRHRVVHAAHFVDNEASARTLVYAGFLYTGRRTLERSLAREGEHQALHMIRIL